MTTCLPFATDSKLALVKKFVIDGPSVLVSPHVLGQALFALMSQSRVAGNCFKFDNFHHFCFHERCKRSVANDQLTLGK